MSKKEPQQIRANIEQAKAVENNLLEAKGKAEHERLMKEVDELATTGSDVCQAFLVQARIDIKNRDFKDAAKVLVKYAECEQRQLGIG